MAKRVVIAKLEQERRLEERQKPTLWGGLVVALWWLCGGFVVRSLCLVYASSWLYRGFGWLTRSFCTLILPSAFACG